MKWTIARLFVYGLGAGFFICAGLIEYLQSSYFVSFCFFVLVAALSATGLMETKRLSGCLYTGDGTWGNPFRPVEDDSEEKRVD